jgi:hypothetical protein
VQQLTGVVADAAGRREWLLRFEAVADLNRDTEKFREIHEGANLTGGCWPGLGPWSPLPIHPDRGYTSSPCPRHVELDGIADKYRLLGSDPGEAERFAKNRGIGFGHTELLRDYDEVDEAIDSEELEFRPLHLGWSVRHDANWAIRLGTRDSLSHL